MHAMDDNLRIEHNSNVRCGLGILIQPLHMTVCPTSSPIERIVYQAELENQLEGKKKVGVQEQLDNLAKRSDFNNILKNGVGKHKLVYADARRCVNKVYHGVSKHAHGNTEPIPLERRYYTASELVLLISFFRLQEK